MPSERTSRVEAALRDYARNLCDLGLSAGLARVGISSARPFERARHAIEDRNARGLSDTMQFTFRNPKRSTTPSMLVPGARSIIVGAVAYYEEAPPRPSEPVADVARYAWRDSYGRLRAALGVVADELKSVGHRATVVADENSLVDREAAYLAGLGWFGKNANLLLPGSGSWFVLGGVITDAVLPVGQPVGDGCGACRRCIDACPTGAIIEPGVVDARRCLAWVIQKPGIVDRDMRMAIGSRIYGCDDCQEACPPSIRSTRQVSERVDNEVTPDAHIDPVEVLEMSDAQILERCGRWYIHDREPRWVRRNALIVLGNIGDASNPRVRRVVGAALESSDAMVRAHAVWAAARLGCADLLPADDPDDDVKRELHSLPSPRA